MWWCLVGLIIFFLLLNFFAAVVGVLGDDLSFLSKSNHLIRCQSLLRKTNIDNHRKNAYYMTPPCDLVT